MVTRKTYLIPRVFVGHTYRLNLAEDKEPFSLAKSTWLPSGKL